MDWRKLRNLAFNIFLLQVAVGCGGNGLNCGGTAAIEGSQTTGHLVIANCADMPPVDLYLNGVKQFAAVNYGDTGPVVNLTFQNPLPVVLREAGGTSDLFSQNILVNGNGTFFVFGNAANPIVKFFPQSSAPNANQTVFTYIQGDPSDTTSYDLYVTPPDADLNAIAPTTIQVGYVGGSGFNTSGFAFVDQGQTYQVRLCLTGTKTVAQDFGTIPAIGTTIQTSFNYYLVSTTSSGSPTQLLWNIFKN